MNGFELYNKTRLVFDEGKVSRLKELILPNIKNILLVYGNGSIKVTGLYDQVMNELTSINANVVELAGIEPNPRLSTVNRGIQLCREHDIQFVLAVGGGSVIDAAKAIAAGALYSGDVWDFTIQKAVIQEALPIGTILTLAATGSEMNGGSVVSNWDTKQKRTMDSKLLYPKFSIVDPTLTYTVPENQTINGIVDIMSHVFEQYFSQTMHTPIQDGFAEVILRTVIKNGEKVLQNPRDYNARANILLSGTYAMNGTLPTGVEADWATHVIEHEVSAIYDLPHGEGLAILFPNWMKHVYLERIEKFVQYAVQVWNIDPENKTDEMIALEGIQATRDYFTRIGAPSSFFEVGIDDSNFERMAEEATRFGTIGKFKTLSKEDVLSIYYKSL